MAAQEMTFDLLRTEESDDVGLDDFYVRVRSDTGEDIQSDVKQTEYAMQSKRGPTEEVPSCIGNQSSVEKCSTTMDTCAGQGELFVVTSSYSEQDAGVPEDLRTNVAKGRMEGHEADGDDGKSMQEENSTRCDSRNETENLPSCSGSTKGNENPHVFPIALKQVRVNIHLTKEIEQLHKTYQNQRKESEKKKEAHLQLLQLAKRQSPRRLSVKVPCPKCGLRVGRNLLQAHMKKHKSLTCSICSKTFSSNKSLSAHQKIVHSSVRPFECTICQKTFVYRSRLQSHMESRHGVPRVYECGVCGEELSTSHALKEHMASHSSDQHASVSPQEKEQTSQRRVKRVAGRQTGPQTQNCKLCAQQFPNRNSLLSHMLAVHGDVSSHQCKFCDKTFPLLSELKSHLLSSHTGKDGRECSVCQKTFKSAETLRRHRVVHLDERPTFPCSECDKVFLSRDGRTKHMLIHMNMNFSCDVCHATFKKESYVRDHKARMHEPEGGAQKCEECGRVYKSYRVLKRHMRIHRQPPQEVKCEQCDKTFKYKKSLAYHMMSHTGKRPYQCEHCGKTFKEMYPCKIHIKFVHSGEELPHKCERCDKGFLKKNVLKNHVESCHGEPTILLCGKCGKGFKSKVSLRRHQRLESGLYSVECKQCGKVLNDKRSLAKHLKTHSTPKSFECSYCGQSFSDKGAYEGHLDSEHSAEEAVACKVCGHISKNKKAHDDHTFTVHMDELYLCAICGKSFQTKKTRRIHMKVHLFDSLAV